MSADSDWAPFESLDSGAPQATLRQIEFIRDLALETGHDPLVVAGDLVGWQVQDLRALTPEEASEVIGWLKGERAKESRGRER